jgi:hypothetical protein
LNEVDDSIEYISEDVHLPVSASCVTFSNP